MYAVDGKGLTNSCQETSVCWTYYNFYDNFGMKHKFAKYLKGCCRMSSDEKFSFKYFLNIAFDREISPKLSVDFGRCDYE